MIKRYHEGMAKEPKPHAALKYLTNVRLMDMYTYYGSKAFPPPLALRHLFCNYDGSNCGQRLRFKRLQTSPFGMTTGTVFECRNCKGWAAAKQLRARAGMNAIHFGDHAEIVARYEGYTISEMQDAFCYQIKYLELPTDPICKLIEVEQKPLRYTKLLELKEPEDLFRYWVRGLIPDHELDVK